MFDGEYQEWNKINYITGNKVLMHRNYVGTGFNNIFFRPSYTNVKDYFVTAGFYILSRADNYRQHTFLEIVLSSKTR